MMTLAMTANAKGALYALVTKHLAGGRLDHAWYVVKHLPDEEASYWLSKCRDSTNGQRAFRILFNL